MPRISLAGFKDPRRRPRFVIWTGVAVLVLAGVVVLMLGTFSTRWFCANACHKVQDDSIIAYSHSSHSTVSCLACHVPANADPITFLYFKLKDAIGIIPTVRNTYELPLNPESELALNRSEMPEATCNQCHDLKTRRITPTTGIVIDHDAHSKAGYQCTMCHNRIAHREDFELTLPGNTKHEDFMTMDACFRCHGLQAEAKAPGRCAACHPKDFTLKPAYHTQKDFYPKGHAELAMEAYEGVAEAEAEAKAGGEKAGEEDAPSVGPVKSVNTCETCHVKATFCDKCHGMTMPHPAEFKKPKSGTDPAGHPAMTKAKATASKCVMCHRGSKEQFCDACHHKDGYVVGKGPWGVARVGAPQQHPAVVKKQGTSSCFKCHEEAYCSGCHVNATR